MRAAEKIYSAIENIFIRDANARSESEP